MNPATPHGAPSAIPAAPRTAPNAAAAIPAPTTCSASARAHRRVRPPWTTGGMVSTIDRPQGPNNVVSPATTEAATTAMSNCELRRTSAFGRELAIRDAEDALPARAVPAHRRVAVDPGPRGRAAVLDVPNASVAASAPAAAVPRVVHERIPLRHHGLTDLAPSLLPRQVDRAFVVDRVAVQRVNREAVRVRPRVRRVRVRARTGREDVTADVVRLGTLRRERDGNHRATGQRDDGPPDPTEERATARSTCEPLSGTSEATRLFGGSRVRSAQLQTVLSSSLCSIRREAVSIRPSSCSSEFTVPFDWTMPSSSTTTTNGTPGTSSARSAAGSETICARSPDARAAAGSEGKIRSQTGHVGDTNVRSRRAPGPPMMTVVPSRPAAVLDASGSPSAGPSSSISSAPTGEIRRWSTPIWRASAMTTRVKTASRIHCTTKAAAHQPDTRSGPLRRFGFD